MLLGVVRRLQWSARWRAAWVRINTAVMARTRAGEQLWKERREVNMARLARSITEARRSQGQWSGVVARMQAKLRWSEYTTGFRALAWRNEVPLRRKQGGEWQLCWMRQEEWRLGPWEEQQKDTVRMWRLTEKPAKRRLAELMGDGWEVCWRMMGEAVNEGMLATREQENRVLQRVGRDTAKRERRETHSEWKEHRREVAEEDRRQRGAVKAMQEAVREAAEQKMSMIRQGPEVRQRAKVQCRRTVGGVRKKVERRLGSTMVCRRGGTRGGRGDGTGATRQTSVQAVDAVLAAIPLLYVVCTQAMLMGMETAAPALAATAAVGATAAVARGAQQWRQWRRRAKIQNWKSWRQEGAVQARAVAIQQARDRLIGIQKEMGKRI